MHLHSHDIIVCIARARAEQEERLRAMRFLLLRPLRLAGVREVTGFYDGYGDSGSIESVEIDDGATEASDDFVEMLGDFIWGVGYHLHPGFENNDGGFGEFRWDIETDQIDLEHSDRFTDHNTTYHVGI